MAQGEYDKALGIYRYIVAKRLKQAIDPGILTELGEISLEKNEFDLACELFRTALDLDPHLSRARYGLAVVFVNFNWLDEASQELDIIMRDDPRFSLAKGLKGEVSLLKGRLKEAGRYIKESVSIRPQDPENHYRLGNLYYLTGRMAEAIKAYEVARLLEFKERRLFYNLGVAYYEEGEYKKAITCWEELLKEDRENPTLNYNLGNAYVKLNDWQKAKERYEVAQVEYHKRLKAIRLAGRSQELEALYLDLGRVYNNIGVVYEELKMEREALRAYTKALECASFARREDGIAYKNLNRSFENRPLKDASQSIHTKLNIYL